MSPPDGPWSGRRLHFVGVGGAGMSGYARAAHALGATVTGSDGALSPYAERLQADGVLEVKIGHDAGNVPAGEDVELIYSSAVPAENPERRGRARARSGRAPARGAAGGADGDEAHDRGGGHARQDDDRVDDRARAARRRPASRAGWWARPWAAAWRTRSGGKASGWWSRPTSPIARC